MSWSHVQTAQNTSNTGTTCATTFTNTVGVGNIVCGYSFYNDTNPLVITGITDDQSNVYTIVDNSTAAGFGFLTFWSNGVLTNSPKTITITSSTSLTAFFWGGIDEFKLPTGGTSPALDGHNIANSDTSSGTFTTTGTGDLIYSAAVSSGNTFGASFNGCQAAAAFNSEFLSQLSPSASSAGIWNNGGNASAAAFGISFIPGPPPAGWEWIQGFTQETVGTNNISLSNVSSGHILAIGLLSDGETVVTSMTDNVGNKYLRTSQDDDSGVAIWGFVSAQPITAIPSSLSWTYNSPPATFNWIIVDEFKPPIGTAAISIDGVTAFMNLSTSPTPANMTGLASSAFQTIQSNVLIYGYASDPAGSAFTPGVTFTQATAGVKQISQFLVQNTPSITNTISYATNAGTLWGIGFGIAPVAATSWQPVQNSPGWLAHDIVTGVTSYTMTWPQKTQAGNIFIGGIGVGEAALVSIVDNNGFHYESNIFTPNTGNHQIFWSGGPVLNPITSITFNFAGSTGFGLSMTEFQPPPFTVSVANDGFANQFSATPGNPPQLIGPVVTTQNGDLIYSWLSMGGTGNTTPLLGMNSTTGWGFANNGSWIIQSQAGSYTVNSNCTSNDAIMIGYAAAFSFVQQLPFATRQITAEEALRWFSQRAANFRWNKNLLGMGGSTYP